MKKVTYRELTTADVLTVRDGYRAKGTLFPTSVSGWFNCPYRWVYERTFPLPDSVEADLGKKIHDALYKSWDLEEGVPKRLEKCNLSASLRALKDPPNAILTAEKQFEKQWEGLTICGRIDFHIRYIFPDKKQSISVYDIKTMKEVDKRKMEKYRDSMQFAWYAFLTNANRVICIPITSKPEYATDGDSAWAEGLTNAHANEVECVLPVHNSLAMFEEVCSDRINKFVAWLNSRKVTLPEKCPNYCRWCSCYKRGICKGGKDA